MKPAEIKARLRDVGFRPSKRLGQNFLLDPTLLAAIANEAGVGPTHIVLEIGAGAGTLTRELAKLAARVITLEIDSSVLPVTRAVLEPHKNVEIVEADALSGPKKGLPLPVHAALQLAAQEGLTPICVSNFPYAIATPFIVKLLEAALIEEAFPLERIAGTVQLEVADRLRAQTITKDYGAPSALVQALAEVTLTRRLGPNAFWPPPKVSSAVINVEPRAAKDRPDAAEWPGYLGLVRGLFQLRRKTIRNGLIRKLGLTAPQAEQALAAAEVDHRARVETLDVTTLRRLARACRPALAAPETPPPTPDPPSRP